MITLSMAWVIVTVINNKDVKEFDFSPSLFLFTGILDIIGAITISLVITGAK